ncbi:MAG TPA: DUF6599 family protein [Pyrinomonadaceae bacterium]
MFRTLIRFVLIASSLAVLFIPTFAQAVSVKEAAPLLPGRVGDLRAQGPVEEDDFRLSGNPEDFRILARARRLYVSPDGETFKVTLIKTSTDSAAFSLLTHLAPNHPTSPIKSGDVGTASISSSGGVFFFKGPAAVEVSPATESANNDALLLNVARLIAEGLDAGEGGVPVLALHLPEWEKVQGQVDYAVSLPVLKAQTGNEPVLDAVSFEGGAEAATAPYGDGRLVVVEFTTPQYATDNDARVTQRIDELRASAERVPAAYRRVGNYAVFVFGVPDAQRAATLIDQVKYEKDVRWLGRNPHEQTMRERYLTTTMGGVVVTTLKATGVAILVCLGVGGLFGGVIFLRRRARSAASEIFTDAGGMLRLDLEDVNSRRVRPGGLLDSGVKK